MRDLYHLKRLCESVLVVSIKEGRQLQQRAKGGHEIAIPERRPFGCIPGQDLIHHIHDLGALPNYHPKR